MKKLYFILIAFIVGISSAFAQDTIPQQTAETGIYTKKSAIYQNDKRLSENEVKQLLSANDEALKMYNNARINKVSGTIFACASGFLIGYGIGGMIGARISNGRTNWEIVGACEGIGVALLIPAIILTNAGNKKIGKAVDIYNGKYGYSPTLNFGLTSNGIGFNINF